MIKYLKNPFIFIGIIALTAAMILSIFSESTKSMVKNNKDLDRKKNVLLARYLEEFKNPNHPYITKLSSEVDLNELYSSEIEELIFRLDGTQHMYSNGAQFSDLVWKEDSSPGLGQEGQMLYSFKNSKDQYLPLFISKSTGGFIIPISGKGLWSTIKGFIYIIPNDEVNGEFIVKGISFYEHAETPGLGGEIDKYEVKARYLNKYVSFKDNKSPEMTKAILDEKYDLEYISGATITSDGLDTFIGYHILDRYRKILSSNNENLTSEVTYE